MSLPSISSPVFKVESEEPDNAGDVEQSDSNYVLSVLREQGYIVFF